MGWNHQLAFLNVIFDDDSLTSSDFFQDNFLTSLESGEHPRAGWDQTTAILLMEEIPDNHLGYIYIYNI